MIENCKISTYLELIFSFFEYKQLIHCRRVCKQFLHYSSNKKEKFLGSIDLDCEFNSKNNINVKDILNRNRYIHCLDTVKI